MTVHQVDVFEAVAEAESGRDQVLDDVAAAATAEARRTADRIIDEAAATGIPFSANDLRPQFELAQIPGPLRGSRIRNAWKNRHVIEPISEVVSSDKGTKGKRVFRYRGTPLAQGRAS